MVISYNAKAIDGQLCLEASPAENESFFAHSPHATMLEVCSNTISINARHLIIVCILLCTGILIPVNSTRVHVEIVLLIHVITINNDFFLNTSDYEA